MRKFAPKREYIPFIINYANCNRKTGTTNKGKDWQRPGKILNRALALLRRLRVGWRASLIKTSIYSSTSPNLCTIEHSMSDLVEARRRGLTVPSPNSRNHMILIERRYNQLFFQYDWSTNYAAFWDLLFLKHGMTSHNILIFGYQRNSCGPSRPEFGY